MKSYKVTKMDRQGRQIVEVLPATDERALLARVKEQGHYILDFEEVDQVIKSHRRLKLNTLVVFCYQLSSMLSAGVGIIDALNMIQSKAIRDKEKRIYRNLYEEVQKGNSLSVAMTEQDGAFDDLLISMVKSGEMSGSLDEALSTMSRQYERDKKIKQKLRTASIYPMVLLVVSLIVVIILVTFVLPGIVSSFPSGEMPFLTRILMAFADFIINKWYVALIVILGIAGGVYLLMSKRESRIKIHRQYLRMPVVGKLLRTVYSARCARSFASLYSHGVPTLDMIELTGKVLGNTYLEDEFEKVYVNVSRGELISTSIDEIGEFDAMLSAMINVGEETGDLEGILNKTAEYFDQESEAALTRLVSLIEPLMIVVMAIIIAVIVISIIQPMFKMYDYVD